jgi:hypothetical protein
MNHPTKVYERNNSFLDRTIHYVFLQTINLSGPSMYLNEEFQTISSLRSNCYFYYCGVDDWELK